MTNSIQEDAQLTNLSDDYIRDLEPDNQRYDITLAQDFVISVLPNGIKTWAFIYDFQGRHRRKTLGVFPEMNFDDAKAALEKARASMLRMDEPTVAPNEFGQMPAVLGGGKYIPKRKKKPFNAVLWLKILGALVASMAIAALIMKAPDWMPSGTSSEESAAPETTPPASLPFALNKSDNDTDSETQTQSREEPTSPVTTPAPATSPSPSTNSNQPDTRASSATNTPTRTQPVASNSTPQPSRTLTPSSTSQSSSTSGTGNTASAPVTTITTTTKATAFGGSVARSRLTSRVQDLEPVDTLGPEISYKNSGFTRVFYFTELREFGDGNVVHRWSLNGEIIDEVVLKVNKSWRWRTYSNKDITPGLNGVWKVETIDATGKILDTETFTYDYQ